MFLYSVYQMAPLYAILTSATTLYHPQAIIILLPASAAQPFILPLSSSFHYRQVGREDLALACKGQHLADLLTGIVHKPFEVIFRLRLIMGRKVL